MLPLVPSVQLVDPPWVHALSYVRVPLVAMSRASPAELSALLAVVMEVPDAAPSALLRRNVVMRPLFLEIVAADPLESTTLPVLVALS